MKKKITHRGKMVLAIMSVTLFSENNLAFNFLNQVDSSNRFILIFKCFMVCIAGQMNHRELSFLFWLYVSHSEPLKVTVNHKAHFRDTRCQ